MSLITKVIKDERFKYLITGGLTTGFDWLAFYILRMFKLSVINATTISWAIAVLFAYAGSKYYVFSSGSKRGFFSIDLCKFIFSRLGTGLLTIVSIPLLSLIINEYIAKMLFSIVVIIINYFVSKIFVFTKKRSDFVLPINR